MIAENTGFAPWAARPLAHIATPIETQRPHRHAPRLRKLFISRVRSHQSSSPGANLARASGGGNRRRSREGPGRIALAIARLTPARGDDTALIRKSGIELKWRCCRKSLRGERVSDALVITMTKVPKNPFDLPDHPRLTEGIPDQVVPRDDSV